VPAIVAAVYESTAAVLIQFLKNPYHHDFIIQRRKLDVVRQPDTKHRRLGVPAGQQSVGW
jgi:hypothetical protein